MAQPEITSQLLSKLDIYSLSTNKIIEKTNQLTHIRTVNHDGFVAETTRLFSPLANPLDPKDPMKHIGSENVISTLFALTNPWPQTNDNKWKNQSEQNIKNVIQGFLGHVSLDPVFFIYKALKEGNISWIEKLKTTLDIHEIERIIDLKEKLLSSINLKNVKQAVAKRINNGLAIDKLPKETAKNTSNIFSKQESDHVGQIETKKLKKIPVDFMLEPSGYRKISDKFSDRSFLQMIEDEKSVTDSNQNSLKTVFDYLQSEIDSFPYSKNGFELKEYQKIPKTPLVSIDHQGQIVINEPKLKNILQINDEPEVLAMISRLKAIFGKKTDRLIGSYLISSLSSQNSPDISWILKTNGTAKDSFRHINKVTAAFCNSLKDIYFNDEIFNSLAKSLSAGLVHSEINFSLINQTIASIIYRNFNPQEKPVSLSVLKDFIGLPGIRQSILSLRKLFLLKVLQNQALALSLDKKNDFILTPTSNIWTTFKMQDYEKLYQELPKNNIAPGNFHKLKDEHMIGHIAFFTVEKYARENQNYFPLGLLPIKINESEMVFPIPNLFNDETTNTISFNSVSFPISTRLPEIYKPEKSRPSGQYARFEINSNDINIATIPISVEIPKT